MGYDNKIKYIKGYIDKCDNAYHEVKGSPEKLCSEIISIFESEIPTITSGLEMYGYGSNPRYDLDLCVLKEKLQLYVYNLEGEKDNQEKELEKLRLQQAMFTVNNQNTNTSSSTSSASATVEVTIEQIHENITKMPEDVLSSEEKEQLKDLIDLLEADKKRKNNEGICKKLQNILKFIAEKSVEVSIAVLPYLGQISTMISSCK